jgi:hypothetical protein
MIIKPFLAIKKTSSDHKFTEGAYGEYKGYDRIRNKNVAKRDSSLEEH